jgi:2-polyprenyl-3-methyl-5-hydroxy-6-metoxy-1,4-benzoquinol methylase
MIGNAVTNAGTQLTQNPLCPGCRHSCQLLLKAVDQNRRSSRDEFYYYDCPECGLVFLYPIPVNLSDYYQSDYPQYSVPETSQALDERAKAATPRVSFVQQFASKGKLLEVGAGYGAFSYRAQQMGFDVQAIEMDASCCDYMAKIGIQAICSSSFDSLDNVLGAFDAIALWHVVEHLEDYSGVISILSRHLSPGGVCVICTPNPASLQFKLFRRFWISLDAPRHLYLIPLKVLTACAAKNGLELAFSTASDFEAAAYNKWCWEASLIQWMVSADLVPGAGIRAIWGSERSTVKKCLDIVRRAGLKSVAIGLGRTLNFLLAPLENSGYRGTSYSAVFRKPIPAASEL